MNERWALEAIAKRELIWENQVFDIVKVTPNHCDGCYFEDKPKCPHQVCNSHNGGILILNKAKTKELATKE